MESASLYTFMQVLKMPRLAIWCGHQCGLSFCLPLPPHHLYRPCFSLSAQLRIIVHCGWCAQMWLSVRLSACLVHFSRLVFDKVLLELMQMTACRRDTYTHTNNDNNIGHGKFFVYMMWKKKKTVM